MRFGVWSLGYGAQSLGYGIQGSCYLFWGLRFRDSVSGLGGRELLDLDGHLLCALGFMGLGFGIWLLGFRVLGSRF